jgi:phosphate acetyltransferase
MEGRERDFSRLKTSVTPILFRLPAFDLTMLTQSRAGQKKLTGDPVAGQADAIVPDFVQGNALFKFCLSVGGCAGGIVMGAKVPILLTSRATRSGAFSPSLGAIVAAG